MRRNRDDGEKWRSGDAREGAEGEEEEEEAGNIVIRGTLSV